MHRFQLVWTFNGVTNCSFCIYQGPLGAAAGSPASQDQEKVCQCSADFCTFVTEPIWAIL